MKRRQIELRHIVDVDGQLIGVDAAVVRIADLLKLAGRGPDRLAFIVRIEERTPAEPDQLLHLDENEVLFVETKEAPCRHISGSRTLRLAA